MQIPGNKNKNGAKVAPIHEWAAKVVHGERGSRKIPDSHNKPHPIEFAGDASRFPVGGTGASKRSIPGSHNKAAY